MKQIYIKNKLNKFRTSNTSVIKCCDKSHSEQVCNVNMLFLGDKSSSCLVLNAELEKKRYNYYRQDLRKKRIIDINEILTQDELIAKLVSSKLICFYCSCNILVFYKHANDKIQWTLDRIDNNLPHTCNNTCIACLDCNLKRRNINHDGFLFTKSFHIRKLE